MSDKMRYFPDFKGNLNLREQLSNLLDANRLSHAYIIEGAHGTGKHMLAKAIAAAINCNKRFDNSSVVPCGNCPACKKILSGNSVDVYYVNRGEGMSIGVEAIRSVCAASELTANENDVAVFIIEEADKMSPAAQNAMLLTLEDPTPNVLFLLLTEDSFSLLATIRSRAAVLKLERLNDSDTEAVVIDNLKAAANIKKRDPEKFAYAIKRAGGSPGKAMELLREKNGTGNVSGLTLVMTMLGTGDVKSTDIYASLPSKSAEMKPILFEAASVLRDLIAVKRIKEPTLLYFDTVEDAKNIADDYSAAYIVKKLETVLKALSDAENNISVPLSQSALFI